MAADMSELLTNTGWQISWRISTSVGVGWQVAGKATYISPSNTNMLHDPHMYPLFAAGTCSCIMALYYVPHVCVALQGGGGATLLLIHHRQL